MTRPRFLVLLLIFISNSFIVVFSQQPFGFERYDEVSVFDDNENKLDFPWVGGVNAVQFNTIDLNNDALPDLVCFDRLGDRILTFINEDSQWNYQPQYQSLFPEIHHWMILRDFNGDGKKDLFTYTTGGIKVFRNEGDEAPSFTQITDPFLTSLQGNIQTNILVTYADYPGIADMDYDGDLDILTFWGLGSFVEMHKNFSMERYGNADSLEFEKITFCWGHFAESEESNELFLDTCINGGGHPGGQVKHTGSTFLLFDKDNDEDLDLLLGDVDYPTMAMLENGGDNQEAHMISQTTIFPVDNPVFLYSFPAAFLEDVDFDNKPDLLVAPFDPSPDHSAFNNNILFYKNTGDFRFSYIQDDFLQDQMIDLGAGAYPSFHDWNNDGLQDLVLGNEGIKDTCYMDEFYTLYCKYRSSLKLYLNTGTPESPEFTLSDNDLGSLFSYNIHGLHPASGDIDGDGDTDIVCGTEEGTFVWLERVNNSFPPDFVVHENAFDAISCGRSSAPALIDIDSDDDMDIICGNKGGMLSWFENTGSGKNPEFILKSDAFGGVDVRDLMVSYDGYSTPSFYRNSSGELQLFVGSESGRIFLYDEIEGNLDGTFRLVSQDLHYLDPGKRSDCEVVRLNGDDYPEILVGNYSGGFTLYKGVWPPSGADELRSESEITLIPNPATTSVRVVNHSNRKLSGDVLIYNAEGNLFFTTTIDRDGFLNDVAMLSSGLYFVTFQLEDGFCGISKLVIIK